MSELVRTIGDELAQCEQTAIRGGKRVPTDKQLKLTPQVSTTFLVLVMLFGDVDLILLIG